MLKFFAYALKFSAMFNGYDSIPPPSQYPPIIIAGEATIVNKCLGDALACYNFIDHTLYLWSGICNSRKLSLKCKAIIIHEATHVLQKRNGRMSPGFCIGDVEKEAYRTEEKWLRLNGSSGARLFGYTSANLAQYTSCL